MDWKLAQNPNFSGVGGPLVLVILDGVGIGNGDESDAVHQAATPTLDSLAAAGSGCQLCAHGLAVGLPTDKDMGNSEVGHNALGAGRVYEQGALLVDKAIASGGIFSGSTWQEIVARCRKHRSALHFIGLLSDGNVHSHIDQLIALVRRAAADGIEKIFLHPLLDGRDVPATSSLQYVDQLEGVLAELSTGSCTAAIASGGGRMLVTMDRYEADWAIVERGWNAHVHGDARQFASARAAIETFRAEEAGIGDQYLPAFVIAPGGEPVAKIVAGDAVINFNFRGDRAIEISRAFDDDALDSFDRGARPDVYYAGMMEYDGDLHVPAHFLVEPPAIENTMGEYLARNGISQLAIAETQKYGHVTYFWNGNRSGKFDDALESYIEIPSDRVFFDQRPWMKAAEITDRLIAEIAAGSHRFIRVNYANGDMVGHTGSLRATTIAIEAVDLQLARLRRAVEARGGLLLVTADHGNADEMYQHKKGVIVRSDDGAPVAKTSHTLNPVPLTLYAASGGAIPTIDSARAEGAGLANIAATCMELLGLVAPDDMQPSLLRRQG